MSGTPRFRALLALLAALSLPARAADIKAPGKIASVPALSLPAGRTTLPQISLPPSLMPGAALPGAAGSRVPSIAVPGAPAGVAPAASNGVPLPALPPAAAASFTQPGAPGAPSAAGAPASAVEPLQPGGVPGIGSMGEALLRAAQEHPESAFSRFFDGASWLRGDPADDGWKPPLPSGAKGVWVDEVRTPDDVERLIPRGANSSSLIEKLKEDLPQMAPYRVYTYRDAKGGKFVAIDISQNPKLIEHFPEQHSHEVALVKKIQLWTKDLQLIVREDGKTPDIVMGGVITELKSLIGKSVDFTFLLNKANTQVYEHANRHVLGHGAAAIDLTETARVPVADILAKLNDWQGKPDGAAVNAETILSFRAGTAADAGKLKKKLERALSGQKGVRRRFFETGHGNGSEFSLVLNGPEKEVKAAAALVSPHAAHSQTEVAKKSPVVLDRVYVFADLEMKVFQRGHDGAYSVVDPSAVPFSKAEVRRGATHQDLRGVQLLIKKGRLTEAEQRLRFLDDAPAGDPLHPVAQARRALEAEVLLGRLAKLVNRSKLDEALDAWQNFVKAHGDEAKALEPRVREVLPLVDVSNSKKSIAEEPERFVRELEEPGQLLDAAGVEATITAYGSARVQPGSKYYEMARRFGELAARFGGGKVGVITGGGPGIMEAANRGAHEAGGPSIGYNIKLPHEQSANPYLTPGLSYDFDYFASRKVNLRNPRSIGLVYFPGGFGTLDELFEVLTLIQTGKMARVPIVLVGEKEHWKELLDFDHLVRQKLISPSDLQLFKYADTAEQAWRIVAEARRSAK